MWGGASNGPSIHARGTPAVPWALCQGGGPCHLLGLGLESSGGHQEKLEKTQTSHDWCFTRLHSGLHGVSSQTSRTHHLHGQGSKVTSATFCQLQMSLSPTPSKIQGKDHHPQLSMERCPGDTVEEQVEWGTVSRPSLGDAPSTPLLTMPSLLSRIASVIPFSRSENRQP